MRPPGHAGHMNTIFKWMDPSGGQSYWSYPPRVFDVGIYGWASWVLSMVASMSSSSSSDELHLSSNWAGMGTLAFSLRAMLIPMPAGDPIDMGLLAPELCPDPLLTWPTLDSPTLFTGKLGARLRKTFSRSETGDSAVPLYVSNGGMETGPPEKCGSVLGPTESDPGLGLSWGCELGVPPGCELSALLDWELGASGSKTELASSSSSKLNFSLASSLGILYGLALSTPFGLVSRIHCQFGILSFPCQLGSCLSSWAWLVSAISHIPPGTQVAASWPPLPCYLWHPSLPASWWGTYGRWAWCLGDPAGSGRSFCTSHSQKCTSTNCSQTSSHKMAWSVM